MGTLLRLLCKTFSTKKFTIKGPLLIAVVCANGINYNWVGTSTVLGTYAWNCSSCWQPNGVPSSNDDVFINQTDNPIEAIFSSVTIRSLTSLNSSIAFYFGLNVQSLNVSGKFLRFVLF
jgi:hypothetical protein